MSNENNEVVLSHDDINNIIQKQNTILEFDTITLFGKKIDKTNLIITTLSIIIIFFIFYFCGLFKIKYGIFFYFIGLIFTMFNLINTGVYARIDPETEIFNFEKQKNNIEGALGLFVLVFIFIFNINIDNNTKVIVSKLLILCIISSCLSIFIFNSKYKTNSIRNLRLFTQKLFNLSVILFIFSLTLIYHSLSTTKI